MTKSMRTLVCLAAFIACAAATPRADDKPIVPLRVQVVIARYQGDKKVSSLPYTLTVNAGAGRTTLRMGSQVPLSAASRDGAPAMPPSYKDLGISLDCSASTLDDGRYRLEIAVDESSLYSEDASMGKTVSAGFPSFRHLAVTNSIVLKDGQSIEFTAATDKVNGEVTKVSVALTVIK